MTSERRRLAEYLIGRLPAGEADAIAERLFGEEDLLNEMEEVERDLLDAYAQDRLSKADGLALETASMSSGPRREKLRFAIALARRAGKPRAYRYWVAAAALLFCVAGATAWIVRLAAANGRLQSELARAQVQRAQLENGPARAFMIAPLQRGSAAAEQLTIGSGTQLIRLNFAIESASPVEVRISSQAGANVLTEHCVPQAGAVSVWLPGSSLPKGPYTAEVTEGDGTRVDYAFQIR